MRKQTEFKVWNTITEKWMEDGIPLFEEMVYDEDAEIDDPEELFMDPYYPFNPDTFDGKLIWLEWTNLLDKDDKKIYDGDLLIDVHNNRFEVVWDSVNARWAAKKDGEYYLINNKELVIFGNIVEINSLNY